MIDLTWAAALPLGRSTAASIPEKKKNSSGEKEGRGRIYCRVNEHGQRGRRREREKKGKLGYAHFWKIQDHLFRRRRGCEICEHDGAIKTIKQKKFPPPRTLHGLANKVSLMHAVRTPK